MAVYLHNFNWTLYTKRVMPAFAHWFIDGDDDQVYELFKLTRCALEEQFLPDPMKRLRVWPRAKAFVDALPRGPYSRKEYDRLCSVEQFTAMSDSFQHNLTPHLYQQSTAVRAVWGAILEEYCLMPFPDNVDEESLPGDPALQETLESEQALRGELVSLLQAAGLADLAREVGEQTTVVERIDWEAIDVESAEHEASVSPSAEDVAYAEQGSDALSVEIADLYASEEDASLAAPRSICIGLAPNTLHMRGWLAGISVRAMALFEYLACGRRRMPFGYEVGEPFGAYCGYLQPKEVWQLASCLYAANPPSQYEAEEDYKSFRHQQLHQQDAFRLIDEVTPTHAQDFLRAVRKAAHQKTGLICSVD